MAGHDQELPDKLHRQIGDSVNGLITLFRHLVNPTHEAY